MLHISNKSRTFVMQSERDRLQGKISKPPERKSLKQKNRKSYENPTFH